MIDDECKLILDHDALYDVSHDDFLKVKLSAKIIDKSIFFEIEHGCNFFCSLGVLKLQEKMSTQVDHLILDFIFGELLMQEIRQLLVSRFENVCENYLIIDDFLRIYCAQVIDCILL
jgi:hypothetical protein